MHKLNKTKADIGISTGLFSTFSEDFHRFLRKKDINLLYLHQNWKKWIKYVMNSESIRKIPL